MMENYAIKNLKTIVVEDEPMALEVMVDYIDKVKGLELIGAFRNGILALEFIQHNQVDLMFLDINMPDLSGMELAKLLQNQTRIIFTTAYSEYAVEGFDVKAVDYLLKPVDFARFLKACQRAMSDDEKINSDQLMAVDSFLLIKSGKETHRILHKDIYFLEGSGNYITYHTGKGKLMSLQTMKEMQTALPHPFVRVHKSYIINLNHLSSFESHQLWIGQNKIPLSQAFRSEFLARLREGGK